LHAMELDELKALLAQIRDELKARGGSQPGELSASVNAEVEKLYDQSRRTPDDVA